MKTTNTSNVPVATGENPTCSDRPCSGTRKRNKSIPYEIVLKKWTPEATVFQTINGAARDLAELISLLIARQRIAVGFEADQKTIQQVLQLTRSLCDLNRTISQSALYQAPKKRGRPRKPRYVNPKLLGEKPEKDAEF